MWDDAGPNASYNNSQPKWLRQYVGCKYVLMTFVEQSKHRSCFGGAAVAIHAARQVKIENPQIQEP